VRLSSTTSLSVGLAAALWLGLSQPLAADPDDETKGAPAAGQRVDPEVFEEAWQKVKSNFYDRGFHGVDWVAIGKKYRPLVKSCRTQRDLYRLIDRMVGELKASHVTTIDGRYYRRYLRGAKASSRYGLSLTALPEGFFVSRVLEGSAADAAGVRRGDRVVSVDGIPPHPNHPRLLPKPYEELFAGPRSYVVYPEQETQRAELVLQRTPRPLGRYRVTLRPHPWSEQDAGRFGAKIVERQGFKLGYFHVYHLIDSAFVTMLHDFLLENREELDGMVLDLRGMGGVPRLADAIVSFFDPTHQGPAIHDDRRKRRRGDLCGAIFGKPVVALIDESARSVKELMAFSWRRKKIGPLVGRTTRGAVIGAMFMPLKDGGNMMVPLMDVRPLTGGVHLEQLGVAPDVVVENPLPYAAGRDAIEEKGYEVVIGQILAARRKGKKSGWY